ncbi:MAG: DUF4843 domain-containing protein [Bacteroidia bacterium]|nr:DUF4843 domain-containing protein [Bacteroidia bacterium]
MKKLYILFTIVLFCFSSCKEDAIMTYSGGDYIQFNKPVTDSLTCSFLLYSGLSEVAFPLPVELVGMPKPSDRKYKVEIDQEFTNAPQANYEIPKEFTFRSGMAQDTCWLTLRKTPEISIKPVRLVVKLVESSDFKLGQTEHTKSIIYITNIIAIPDWWNTRVRRYYLGVYSDKKYRLFIQVTGKITMDVRNEDELRFNTLLLKYYLQKEKDAGRTVYEDDGTEMKVTLTTG